MNRVALLLLLSLLALVLSPKTSYGRRKSKKVEAVPRLRPVLSGILYRSGSPTDEGLEDLCQKGFVRVYSLYGPRTTAHGPKNQSMLHSGVDERQCTLEDGRKRVMPWLSSPGNRGKNLPQLFADIRKTLDDPKRGPILVHCWNGLHYAGMVAAMTLRQFCGYTADQAEVYWRQTANKGAHYPHVIAHIRAFRPLRGYSLSDEERKSLCPQDAPKVPRAQAQAEYGQGEVH